MPGYLSGVSIKNSLLAEIDAGLKACMAILLTALALSCEEQLSLLLIFFYTVLATIFLGSNLRFLFKNVVSYGIIFMFPYFFGLFLAAFMGILFSNNSAVAGFGLAETLLRVVKIFFVWYIGSLYIYSTPLPSVLGMLKTVFSPLNSIGIPVNKYLVVIKCVVTELNESVGEFKSNALEQARSIFRKSTCFKIKIRELADIIVFFIANSLHRTEHIQELVANTDLNDLTYSFKVTKNEIVAILSLIILLVSVILAETLQIM
jgi:energy-coupling factor transporter transmembrane protein EcfT